ncbi:hypothetical protein P280DRAFT_409034 [Massarina eburnea CBS 473.64]|uniref:U6 snRNA phosphodiesterase n=1 Tax=Massarina eburnea CBS 473.64 TaxID=1395130 RepID=A0A6A6RML6_9PLEO|nr:hypothetical protein P280DRAFT_409034 [Massarina eburnea CBS 473.64]
MSLVLYPDSDAEEDSSSNAKPHVEPILKRKRGPELPPLPAAFHDLYAANARVSTSDDPSLHGGRKRAVPHVEGNWPSHVYLEWVPSQPESQSLHALIDQVKVLVKGDIVIAPSLLSPLGTPLPLHISLSRTLQIRTDDREPFLQTLITSLRKAAVRPFSVRFSRLKWVPNFDRNRWFLVLVAEKPAQDELNRLLAACNDAARRCRHPALYTGGRGDGPMDGNTSEATAGKRRKSSQDVDCTENFHVSIAWNLVEPDPAWSGLVQKLDISNHVDGLEMSFNVVKAKIGNAVSSIDLASRKAGLGTNSGLLGLG